MRRAAFVTLLLAASLVAWRAAAQEPAPTGEAGFQAVARPFLQKHCLSCHDRNERSGELALDAFGSLADVTKDDASKATWRKVLERVNAGEMPPEEAPRPSAEEVRAFSALLREAIGAGAASGPIDPGRVVLRRLNRAEYGYTVLDLLQVPRAGEELPQDDVGYGFDRIGDVLSLPPLLLEKYLAAGEKVAQQAILDWKPVKLRLEGETAEREGSSGGERDGFGILYSNGRLAGTVKVPVAGEYVVRARAYGLQAGPDPARMALMVDGKTVTTVDVTQTVDAPGTFDARVTLEPGQRRLAAAFTNDFYAPNAPDESQRDRNLAVDFVELEGPVSAPPLPFAHRTYVTKRPAEGAKPAQRKAVAKEVLGPLVNRAFRRPARPDELERLARLVDVAMTEGDSFERGLQLALQAILCSTPFLYRFEDARPAPKADKPQPGARGPKAQPLDDHSLATRLAYYLWSSTPDDELLRLAAEGELAGDVKGQAQRLLGSPKASRLAEEFAVQWLQLRRLDQAQPDPARFPGFDERLRASMREETVRFFDAAVRENLPVLALIDAPFTFLDEALARHYGVAGVTGPEFRRVEAAALGPGRGGVLRMASVLTATSNPTRTSPVKRGRWVLEVLLDDPPPPPLPGMDSLKDEGTPLAARTLRERMEQHRARPECASCHVRMDPVGFALERYDAVGARRERDGEFPVDDTATLPGGKTAQGVDGLAAWLRGKERLLARALARKLLIFATGRGPVAADDAALDALVERLAPTGWRLQDLIIGITSLDAFQKRRAGKGEGEDPARTRRPQ